MRNARCQVSNSVAASAAVVIFTTNHSTMKRIVLLSIIALIAQLAFGQQNFDTVKIRPIKVSENIYMLKGSGGNIGVLTGKDGVFMIDDQYAPLSQKIQEAIKKIDPSPIRILVNTHVHGDHSGGNENFKKLGVTIVAHDQVRARMMMEQFNTRLNRTIPPRDKEAWPAISFDGKLNLFFDDEDIELIHLDRGHTDGDVIVHFKQANIFHTGDTYVRSGYPFIDISNGGSFAGFMNTLEITLALANDNSKIIPGHGELATKSDMKAFRDKMADIRDKVVAALKNGTKVEDIPALGITDKYDAELGKGFVKGKDFVLLIATDLKASVELKK